MKTIFKWLIYLTLSAILVIVTGWYVFRKQLQEIALHRLKVELEATFENYYQLQYDSIETAVIAQTLNIRVVNPIFSSDTSNKKLNKRFPAVFFKADEFAIGGIAITQLLLSNKLEIGSIVLHTPQLVLLTQLHPSNAKQTTDSAATEKRNRKLIGNIHLHHFAIENARIASMALSNPTDTLYHALAFSLIVDNLKVPLVGQSKPLNAATLQSLDFTMKNASFNPKQGDYRFKISQLGFQFPLNELDCKKVQVIPKTSLLNMSRKAKFQKTVATFTIGNIVLSKIGFKQLSEGKIHLEKLVIANARFNLLRNKEKRLDTKTIKPTFQQSLHQLKVPLQIDTVQIRNVAIIFQLKMPGQQQPGVVSLSNINARILAVNNAPQNRKPILVTANAILMKSGKLQFSASIPPHLQTHSFKGMVKQMPMKEWNPLIERMAPLRIENGTINRLTFSGTAKTQTATGKFAINYRDLDITILKKSKDGTLKPAKILTFAANNLIQKNQTATTNNASNQIDFTVQKEPYQGQIMLWIGSIIEGMESTLLPNALKKQVDILEAKQLAKKRQQP